MPRREIDVEKKNRKEKVCALLQIRILGKISFTIVGIRSSLIQQKGKGRKEPNYYLELPGNRVLHEKFLVYF